MNSKMLSLLNGGLLGWKHIQLHCQRRVWIRHFWEAYSTPPPLKWIWYGCFAAGNRYGNGRWRAKHKGGRGRV